MGTQAVATSTSAPAAAAPAPATQLWPALRLAGEVLRPDSWLLAFTTAVLLFTIATTLAFPVVIGELFDLVRNTVVGAGAATPALSLWDFAAMPPSFRWTLFVLVACLALSTLGNVAVAVLSPLVAERFAVRLRDRMMEVIISKPQSFFDQTSKGDLISRLSLDVTILQITLDDCLGERGFRSVLECLGCLAIMAYCMPLLALVAVGVTPAMSCLLRGIVVRSTEIDRARQRATAQALEFASDRLRHVQTVQVFDAQRREAEAFAALSEEGYALAKRFALFQGMVEGFGRLAVNVGALTLLCVGGWLVLRGHTSVGVVLAAQVQCLFLSVGLSSVAASLGELGKAIGALERITALAEGEGDSDSGGGAVAADSPAHAAAAAAQVATASERLPGAVEGHVQFQDVWFRYPGREDWALQGFSLDIAPGQKVALVGASGGGKSTVAALLLGLYQPERGAVLVDGRPLSDPAVVEALRPHMAAVLQQPQLLAGSVTDNIRYGQPGASEAAVEAAARAASADSFVRELPAGYATPIGERGHTLSGGQKQRLAIARALLTQPKVLVLDEVTSALDVEAEHAIDRALELLPGTTKLMVAHRLSTIRHADSIAVVDAGRVVEQGTHEELEARPGGAYRHLLRSAELRDDTAWAGGTRELAGATAD
eukprot:scaffold3.g6287.t1